ncbi:MAG: GNAT family N-acetyltransferase [bacterium]|nr:GNAT family N-acetyltransferase [bacterium]
MEIKQTKIKAGGIKFFIEQDGKEAARAYLYVLKNDLHEEPFGFLEDVFVDESLRGQGLGTKLLKEIFRMAKISKCYKIVATSRHERPKVHDLYERLGFKNRGLEFRMDLPPHLI